MPSLYKIGLGYDSHRFVTGRPLVLGGVIIPFEYGLEGHSDADALLHALADALLGATGLGDVGRHFPDSDDRYRDMASTKILAEVFKKVIKEGYRVGNADAVIIAERPRMEPHIPAMKAKIARILLLPERSVSIKATSNEKMGFIGREEGLAVLATTLIYEDDGTDLSVDK